MTDELKEAWIAALRSGHYDQGRGGLLTRVKDDDGVHDAFCCLGVLCDVIAKNRWEGWVRGNAVAWEGPAIRRFVPFRAQTKLVQMNDKEGCSFAEIADWIERASPETWEQEGDA